MTNTTTVADINNRTGGNILLERKYGKTIGEHVRQFGLLWLVVGMLVACYFGYHGSLAVAATGAIGGVALLLLSRIVPHALVPLWRGWMAIGIYLGMVATPVLLTIVWFLMVIPISLILRLLGTQVVNKRFREDIPSYWEERKERKFSPMTRQF